MSTFKRICVYLGSNPGKRPIYKRAIYTLVDELIKRDIGLVYGGSNVGTMKILADRMLEKGGEVIGVIPESLVDREIAHTELTQQHIVNSMHERKALMEKLSDGFIAIPGGLGTLDELAEILTWRQLGFHQKPCGLLNVDGYYDHLLAFFAHAGNEGFIREEHWGLLKVATQPKELLDSMAGA